MTQAEKFAKAREFAMGFIAFPEGSETIGTGEKAVPTPFGVVKVKVTAVKDEKFDIVAEAEAFEFERAEAEAKAEKVKADREAKKSAKAK